MDRSKKKTKKRGRAKISVEELNKELKIKEERVNIMRSSLKQLKKKTKHEVVTESDLEEFNELLSTDDEEEYNGKLCFMRTCMYLLIPTKTHLRIFFSTWCASVRNTAT